MSSQSFRRFVFCCAKATLEELEDVKTSLKRMASAYPGTVVCSTIVQAESNFPEPVKHVLFGYLNFPSTKRLCWLNTNIGFQHRIAFDRCYSTSYQALQFLQFRGDVNVFLHIYSKCPTWIPYTLDVAPEQHHVCQCLIIPRIPTYLVYGKVANFSKRICSIPQKDLLKTYQEFKYSL